MTEDPTRSRGRACCGAAYAVDVGSPSVSEHAASHVVCLVVGIGGCLGSPAVAHRVVFKRMSELVACCVGGAPTHRIKLPVGREIDANQAHPDTRQAWTRRPAGC